MHVLCVCVPLCYVVKLFRGQILVRDLILSFYMGAGEQTNVTVLVTLPLPPVLGVFWMSGH